MNGFLPSCTNGVETSLVVSVNKISFCRCICESLWIKRLACNSGTKSSAGSAPEMDLKNPLHDGNKAHQWGIHPGLETRRCHQG